MTNNELDKDKYFIAKIIELLSYDQFCTNYISTYNIIKSSRFLHCLYYYDFADFSDPEFCKIEASKETQSVILWIKVEANKKSSKAINKAIKWAVGKGGFIVGSVEYDPCDGFSVFCIMF